ncbi:MAG TPA: HlyC/CorC family transporter [bacterium (Candidatus Stahlbacteria)]|nr:HlyC/CorC family transporter [Candidatus Stahlbacteria bacterium]
METALFSISRTKLKALLQLKQKGSRNIFDLKKKSDLLLVVLLTGNLVVNVSASALATLFVVSMFTPNDKILLIEALIMSGLLLIIGEITPKVIARRNFESFALRMSPYFKYVYSIFLPIAMPFYLLVKKLIPSQQIRSLSPEDLRTMVDEAKLKKAVSDYEAIVLRQLLNLGVKRVVDVMTPRNSIIAIPATKTVAEALKFIRKNRHSRIMVYGHNLDNVVGVLYAKDILLADANATIMELIKEPIFVPETKKLDSLLEHFMRVGCHLSIVVDEYGGVSGLVTLEDVLEAIFGEIIDESDDIEDRDYIALGEGRYLISGDLDMSVLYSLFGQGEEARESKRVSAYLMDKMGTIPVEGETIRFDHLEAKISKVEGNRIVWLVVRQIY